MAVYIELAQGDTLVIGKSRIRLERKSGQRARLMIDSAEDIERVKASDHLAMPTPTQAPAPPANATPLLLKRPVPAAS